METLRGFLKSISVIPISRVTLTQAIDAAKQATEKFGRINVLVNNASYGLLSAVKETSNEEVKQNYDANVFGLLNVNPRDFTLYA